MANLGGTMTPQEKEILYQIRKRAEKLEKQTGLIINVVVDNSPVLKKLKKHK